MRHRFAAVATCAVLALAGAAGCGRDEGGGSQAAKSVGGGKASGAITVWAMGTEGEKLAEFAKAFTAENPDASVTVTPVPWDAAHQKIASAIAARQTPDVSMIGTTMEGEFAKTGALDVTPAGLFDKGRFFPGAWDTTVVGGASYGIPWYVETRGIYYRTDLAAKAGFPQGPRTWADLTAMSRAMKDRAGAKWGINLQPSSKIGSWQSMLPFGWSNGAEIAADGKYTFDTPELTEALRYYQSFFTSGLAPASLPQGALEPAFVRGEVGSFISGPWHVGILADQGGKDFAKKYAVATMPVGKSSTSFIGGSNLAVFKDAKNRDSAWKFLAWLSRPDVQVKWYRAVNDLPAVAAAWDDPALAGDPVLKVFGTQLRSAKAPPAYPTWDQVSAVLDTEVEKVCAGREEPGAALKAVQKQADAIGTGL